MRVVAHWQERLRRAGCERARCAAARAGLAGIAAALVRWRRSGRERVAALARPAGAARARRRVGRGADGRCRGCACSRSGWISRRATRHCRRVMSGCWSATPDRPPCWRSSRRHGRTITVKAAAADRRACRDRWRGCGRCRATARRSWSARCRPRGSATLALTDSAEKLFFTVARLGLTIEPLGGDPRAPAGPFFASGHCVKLW